MPLDVPSPDSIRGEVDRILTSSEMSQTERLRNMLRFVVEQTLAGNAGRLKGTTLAIEVFGRDETFDPRNDAIVRVEALRLRERLRGYYAGAGRHDPVRIEIPKGSYVPRFHQAAVHPTAAGRIDEACPSVTVRTLDNLSGEAAMDLFCAGLTEELYTELDRQAGCCAIVRNDEFHGGTRRRGDGFEPCVDWVLAGSVRAVQSHVRVSARLVDTARDVQRWAASFDRHLGAEDVLDLHADLACHIVQAAVHAFRSPPVTCY